MIPKKCSWSILAQCDLFAVQSLVESAERLAMKTLAPMKESIFQRTLSKEKIWRETYEAVCSSYQNLSPSFSIEYDNFGGYRLVYTGKETVKPPFVFKRSPVGFIRSVPDGVSTNLSVMSSERTGEQLLLLGPIRFVNSDCAPNCEYDFSSDLGIVQLRVRKRIHPGEEIFVKYGDNFFEHNECRCRTCSLTSREEQTNSQFEILLSDVLQDLANEVISDEQSKRVHTEELEIPQKIRRIKGLELTEWLNNLEESPLSSDSSPVSRLNQSLREFEEKTFTDSPVSWASPIDSSFDSVDDGPCCGLPENTGINVPAKASSPLRYNVSACFSASTIREDQSSFPTFLPNDVVDTTKIFEGSQITVSDASTITDLFCSRYKLSDECSTDLHSLIKNLLPVNNNFPTGYSFIKKVKTNFENSIRILEKSFENSFCVLNFRFQIGDIIKQHFFFNFTVL